MDSARWLHPLFFHVTIAKVLFFGEMGPLRLQKLCPYGKNAVFLRHEHKGNSNMNLQDNPYYQLALQYI
ncbi:MAG: hypothetical protein ACI4AJ_00945, partial [Bacteroidaceae bacterium]